MRVALVHYWLIETRGGEAVLEALAEMFPDADIYTHVVDRSKLSPSLARHRVIETFIGRLPFAKRLYQFYLPLMPRALEGLDLNAYDLVISSESGPAKGVITHPDSLHICYCHSPMRYIWDKYWLYRDSASWAGRIFMTLFSPGLRAWDVISATRVDLFIANSNFVARRIGKFYRREATVIAPPLQIDDMLPSKAPPSDYFVYLGQLIPYKRVDIAVDAFNVLGRRLKVIGGGPSRRALQAKAGPNIEFLGRIDRAAVISLLSGAAGLIFPGEEDFGIVALEAMAVGRPVIAYGAGGILDTITDGETGILFPEQSSESLIEAIHRFDTVAKRFDPAAIRKHALTFRKEVFQARMHALINQSLQQRRRPPAVDRARAGSPARLAADEQNEMLGYHAGPRAHRAQGASGDEHPGPAPARANHER